jgi:hypothetical protein
LHEIFVPPFFINQPHQGPDSWSKAVSHMVSYSPGNLIIIELNEALQNLFLDIFYVMESAAIGALSSISIYKWPLS